MVTLFLCRNKKEPVNEIMCHSLEGAPSRPVSLDNLEMENTQGQYNRRPVSKYHLIWTFISDAGM